jgi:penicillin-binding protein 2
MTPKQAMDRKKRRLGWFFCGTCLLFCGLVLKLALVQLKESPVYSYCAFRQQAEVVPLEEHPRGGIVDRNGVSLTGEHWEKGIVLFPSLIADEEAVAAGLAAILEVPPKKLQEQMKGKPRCLPYRLDERQAALVEQASWPGVAVVPVKRRYGTQPMAVHVTGYLGKIDTVAEWRRLDRGEKRYHFGDSVGKAGCEYYYEHLLKGTVPCAAAGLYRDARGISFPGLGIQVRKQADPMRADLVLTLDARVQCIVEEVMDRHIPQGAAVVLEAYSGDILAVASRPAFNPAAAGAGTNGAGEAFLNRAFAPYPPGSIFKIVVAAAALNEGVVRPETGFFCRGAGDSLVRCWHAAGHGKITFARAFAQSCNPVFARVGLALRKNRLLDYYRAFGLEERYVVGYPLPRDRRQALTSYLGPHNLVNLSIGQGPLLLTPVQVAAVVNTILRDGVYVRPRLVKGFRRQNRMEELARDTGRRVLSTETARLVRGMMAEAAAAGTACRGYVEGWGSAGKTGSAEAGADRVCAWFAGYAPLEEPRYVIVVMLEDSESGAHDAAPVFREIAARLLGGGL